MMYQFRKRDILIVFALCFPKFVIGILGCMVIPIFPSLIAIHFNNSNSANIDYNISHAAANSTYNYYQLSILYVTKSFCQIFMGPVGGYIINWFGSLQFLFLGVLSQIVAILFYGVGNMYYLLLIGRIFGALAVTAVNGAVTAFIAQKYKDHKQRGFVYGTTGLSLCIGSAIGPAFGGYMYQYYGKTAAFLFLFLFISVEITFMTLVMYRERKPKAELRLEMNDEIKKEFEKELSKVENHLSKRRLLLFAKDLHFIMTIAVCPLFFSSLFLLYASLPRYMAIRFTATESQQGLVWVSTLLGYAVGFLCGNIINTKCPRHRHIILMLFTAIHAVAMVGLSLMPTWWSVSIPLGVIVCAHMTTEVVMTPILTTIVERNHYSDFGTMSGIFITMMAISVVEGSFLGPVLLSKIGLRYMTIGVAVINVIYAPFYLFLGRFCRMSSPAPL